MGNLICTVELDKKSGNGIKVTVANSEDGIDQTVQLNGTSIVISVKKGSDEPSTYTQTADAVSISCKKFHVTASETITMTSKQASRYESSDGQLTLIANQDLSVKSEAADVTVSAVNIKASATTQLALAVEGNVLELAEQGASLSSPAKTAVSGGVIAIEADGMLSVEASGPASFKGAIANISGNLVNLG